MLIDLDVKGRKVAIVGAGKEAELKAVKALDAGASVTVIAQRGRVALGLERLAKKGALSLLRESPEASAGLVKRLSPAVLFVSTGVSELDEELAKVGRSCGSLVCVVDAPALNDFNMPALARIGSLRVGISSGGRSPAMVKILRKRIERTIKPEDLLQVELQHRIREYMKERLGSPATRKKVVYRIIRDRDVARLLKDGDIKGAERRAKEIIRAHASPRNFEEVRRKG